MAVGASIQGQASDTSGWRRPHVHFRMLLVAAIVASAISAVGIQLIKAERSAWAGYDQARAQVQAAVAEAERQGYSPADMTAVTAGLDSDGSRAIPFFLQRTSFYDQRRSNMLGLLADLPRIEAEAKSRRIATARISLSDATAAIEAARGEGADPTVLSPLKVRLEKLTLELVSAATPKDIDSLVGQAGQIVQDASAAGAAAIAERARLTQAADALKAHFAGNLDQVRAAGAAAVGAARNDGTVATLLKIAGTGSLAARIEHFASMLPGSDLGQVALAAAGAQTYQKRIHELLVAKMPAQTITISLSAQELWAYQDGKVVQDTLVTTGRPALPTDVGAMKVLWKQSPWKMHSPWPRSSPYWYPDTRVEKVVWFTVTGEGLHDSSWEPNSLYGPGGQFTSSASHGCVHVLMPAENFLYDWAQIGTPVIVYPGDGSPVADQMKQVSVAENGVPFTGPKGA